MYFLLSQWQYLVLSILGGLLLILVLVVGYWSFRLSLSRRPDTDEEPEAGHEFAEGLREGNRPIPLFIILMILVFLIWGVAYVIAVARGAIHVQ